MSHTPRLSSGYVFKRYLNAIRPRSSGGPVPPSGLVFFYAETLIPAETVTGPAEAERDEFVSYITSNVPETFEEFELDINALLDDVPLSSNGNAFHFAAGSTVIVKDNNNNRFNTTPGGLVFAQGDNFFLIDLVFDTPTAGFGAFFTDMGDFAKNWTATIYDEFNNPTVVPFGNTVNVPGTLIFWGWLDNTGLNYSHVEFTGTGGGIQVDAIGIDDILTVTTAQIDFGP